MHKCKDIVAAVTAAALAEALGSNTSLTQLSLISNGIGEQGKQLLRDAVGDREGFELLLDYIFG